MLPTPGHPAGHLVLLHLDKHLFTGDHLWWDPEAGRLDASRRYCWHSWSEQRRSMERLRQSTFEWVLPGHGARHQAPAFRMRQELDELIARMS
jgi:glyoxylase-like metal-dependent hydrolase (beta-lactamase superfamily II)